MPTQLMTESPTLPAFPVVFCRINLPYLRNRPKWTVATGCFGSTSDLQLAGQPVGDPGQVVWRAWLAVQAMIGQQARNLQLF